MNNIQKGHGIIALLAFISFVTSCGAPPPTKEVPAEFKAGQANFHKVCSNCHGPDAMSPANFKAPRLIDEDYLAADFSDDDIRETIDKGTDKMPSQKGKFSAAEIDEIIKYLRYSQNAAGLTAEEEDPEENAEEEEGKN